MSLARLLRQPASVKKLVGLSSAELTLLPGMQFGDEAPPPAKEMRAEKKNGGVLPRRV